MRLSPAFCPALVLAAPAAAPRADECALHGHDLGGQRYSPLTAIDTRTVRRLVPRWTYHAVAVGGNALFGVTQGDMVMAFGLAP